MADVEWMEPPAEAFMSTRELVVKELKKNPGRWARVLKDRKSRAGTTWWRDQRLEVVVAPAASAPELFDVFARAPGRPGQVLRDGGDEVSKSKPLVAQKVTRARPEAQGTPGRPSSGSAEDLTPEKVAAQLKARRDALRSGSRG